MPNIVKRNVFSAWWAHDLLSNSRTNMFVTSHFAFICILHFEEGVRSCLEMFLFADSIYFTRQ